MIEHCGTAPGGRAAHDDGETAILTAAPSRYGSVRRVLAAVLLTAGVFALAHAGTASAATTCALDCPHIFGLAPPSSGDILDTSANLTFFATGASTPGNDYTWEFVYGLHGGALDRSTPGTDTIAAGSFTAHSAVVGGLLPNTAYDVQAIATGPLGQEVDGPLQTFSTIDSCSAGHCLALSGAFAPNTFATAADISVDVVTGGSATQWRVEWESGSETGFPHASAWQSVSAGADGYSTVHITGLAPSTSYSARIVATNDAAQNAEDDFTFQTLAACSAGNCADPRQPSVFAITATTADVAGFIGTMNQPTSWTMELSSDGGATWTPVTSGTLAASNLAASEVDWTLTGLTPQAQYEVRLVADNGEGAITGPAQSFVTSNACAFGLCPDASIAPTLLKAARAVLGGTIDTKGSPTSWVVHWGTTTGYTGGTVSGDTVPAATGGATAVDPVTITGLQPSTAYHYQVVATNGWGTTTGPDQTFTTSPPFVDTDSIFWQSGPGLPKPWSGFTAAGLNATTMFVTGNDLNGSIYSFNPYNGQDEFTLQAGHAPYATQEEGSAFLNGNLWLMSVGLPINVNNQPPRRVTEIYDTGTDTWSLGPVVQNEDALSLIHPAFVNAAGTLFAFGGRGVPGPGRSHIYDEAWRLSADQSQWLAITPPPTPVADPGVATGNDGRIYLFGGVACVRGGFDGVPWFADCLNGAVTNITQIYNPATDTWSLGAPMPTARYSLTAIHAGCALYAVGGLTNRPLEPQSPGNPTNDIAYGPSVSTVEVYNTADDRWIPGPAIQQPRADFAAAFVGHQVWVLGGGPQTQLSTTEYITPAVVASTVASPAQPNGLNGWYVTDPTLTLDACNGIGGPASLVYGFDGSTSGHAYSGSPQVVTAPEGLHTFTYGAFDQQNNAATNVTRTFKVDTIPPTIAFAGLVGGADTFTVADTGSGVDHVVFTATTPGGTVALGTQTTGFSIPASSLPPGTTAITAVAYDVAGNHSTLTQSTTGTPTQLTLLSQTRGVYGHRVTLSALLRDTHGSPLAGKTVVLQVGTQSCTDTTDLLGIAVCTVTLSQTPGTLPLSASFAGKAPYLPASATGTFKLQKAPTELEITSEFVSSKAARLTAVLTDDLDQPLAGRTVTFLVGSLTVTATTNGSGVATTGTLSLSPGRYSVTASWPGDANYTADSQSGSVIVYKPTRFVVWGDDGWRHTFGNRSCDFWGSQWSRQIGRDGSFPGSSGFKGYASSDDGRSWNEQAGNSSSPPDTVASYISVIVTTHGWKSGSTYGGDVSGYAIVKVDESNPGQDGTGVVVGVLP